MRVAQVRCVHMLPVLGYRSTAHSYMLTSVGVVGELGDWWVRCASGCAMAEAMDEGDSTYKER